MTTIADQLPQRDAAILQRFIDGQDPAQISDAMNLGILEVGAVINSVKRSKTRAREVLDQQSPLTAPIVPRKSVTTDLRPQVAERPTPPAPAPLASEPERVEWKPPAIDLSRLDNVKELLDAAQDLDDERVNSAHSSIRLALAGLRQMVEKSIRRQAVMDERAKLLEVMAAQDAWIEGQS